MRILALLALALASTAVADTPTLTERQVKLLEKAGYKSPTNVFHSPALRVESAKQHGKQRLVIVTADKVVDAGVQSSGTLSVTISTTTAVAVPRITQLEVSYTTPGANDSYTESGSLWVVRNDGSIACVVAGSSHSSSGTACGSSGWTKASSTLKASPSGGLTLDVRYDHSGNWSTPDSTRGCLHRSPVRSSRTERWLIPTRGTYKKSKTPRPPDDASRPW